MEQDFTDRDSADESKPPLLILHGLLGQGRNWARIASHRDIGGNRRVFALELRNHGDSPHFPSMTLDEMSRDILTFLDQQQIEKAVVLGHSLGGRVAMVSSFEFPNRISAMIAADISPGQTLGSNTSTMEVHNIIRACHELDFSTVTTIKDADAWLQKCGIEPSGVRSFVLKNLERDKDSKEYRWKCNMSVMHRSLQDGSLLRYNYQQSKSEMPALFLCGSESSYIQPKDHDLIFKLWPKAKIETVPHAGHWVQMDNPAFVVQTVTSFLKSLG